MRTALVTFYQTKYGFLDLVLPRFRRYASRIGAEMVEVNMDGSRNVFMDKFFHVAGLPYDRCIVLDVDMLLREDTPDLFGIVPPDSVGMYDEGSAFHYPVESELIQIEARHKVYCHLIDYCGFDPSPVSGTFSFERPLRYYNMGVVVYNRQAMDLHGSIPQELVGRLYEYRGWTCAEQTLLSYLILSSGMKVFHLPVCFNQMPCNRCADYLKTSYVSHYAGLGEAKEHEIARDDLIWKGEGL
jgi:hypothetical protein